MADPATHACALVFSDDLLRYDFGPTHPMAPHRVELTLALARDLGVLEHVRALAPPVIDDAVLARIHTPSYLDAVRAASADPAGHYGHGLGTTDNPTFSGMHEACRGIVAASVGAARAVIDGTAPHAANLTGGLHHAMPDAASGFCIYNDVAAAINELLDSGYERIAYVDVDAHHGDGVEAIFAADPRVLTISLHESPMSLFPHVGGMPIDLGGAGAEGLAVNVPLPAGTGDRGFLRAFDAVVPPLLEAFDPDVLVTQQGADGHRLDPLTHLAYTVDGQRETYRRLHELAHSLAGGRWVLLGGGGYATVEVVPRAWTHLLAIAAGSPVPPGTALPGSYVDLVLERLGAAPGCRAMNDGTDVTQVPHFDGHGYDPGDRLDQVILATRRAVFPYHGLALDW